MLMYVIPLVILVVVLIVIKKRQDAQGTDQPTKKSATKGKTKPRKAKVSNSKAVAARPIQEVEDDFSLSTIEQPIPEDLRSRIEGLIKDRNFFAAEAQINQALKQNNAQHGLYLLLLDIHISQKDDFAIDQLLNHLKSLELENILMQAEAKVAEQSQNSPDDLITYTPENKAHKQNEIEPTPTPTQIRNNDDAFESLIATNLNVSPQTSIEPKPQAVELPKAVFKPEHTAKDEIQTLEFDLTSLSNNEPYATPVPVSPVEDIQPLDFTFSLASKESENKTQQNIEVETSTTSETTDLFTLDFSVAESNSIVENAQPQQIDHKDNILEFALDFKVSEVTETQVGSTSPSAITETPVITDLDFNIDAPTTQPLSFVEEAPIIQKIVIEETVIEEEIINHSDPLIQAFPELAQMDEIELNLDLAKKYIQLGAYDAAREILLEKDADYSLPQREIADQLLNQIAS